jgi:predicted methyltransferase
MEKVPDAIAAAVAHSDRSEGDRRRDADRRPGEVLAFFGVEPGQRVAEIMASTGYYTELLSRVVGPEGHVYAQNNRFVLERFAEMPLSERLARPGLENVTRLDREIEDPGLPEGLDGIFLIRFYHDFYWMEADRAALNRAVFAALRPGGVYGVVDHHAEAGSGARDVETLHRVDAEMVKQEILSAGFVFEAESDALRHPEDKRDWNIFADNAARRDRTDRFVYRFRKPDE